MKRSKHSASDSSLEKLEDRTLFSTYVVNVVGDPTLVHAHQLPLRSAVDMANSHGGTSVIEFDPGVFSTDQTIFLQAPLTVSNPAARIIIIGPAAGVTLNQDLCMYDSTTLYVKGRATLDVSRMNFTTDSFDLGSYVIKNAGQFEMAECTVSSPDNTGGIGGIYNSGRLTLNHVTIANHGDFNSDAAFGAGLYNTGVANLQDVTFQDDDANAGGAIGQTAGTLNAVNVTFNDCSNDVNGLGGAVAIDGGTASFTNSTFDGSALNADSTPKNSAGAALYVGSANVTLINDTITNSGIYPLGYGMHGDVPTAGAIFVSHDGKLSMGNTVVSGMVEEGGLVGGFLGNGPEIVGRVNSLGHNLIGQTSSLTLGLVSSDLRGTHASPLNPGLSALANNGGYTETELPKFSSILINAGDDSLIPMGITTDQRGDARIFDGTVDIGAVEYAGLIVRQRAVVRSPFKG
jgi:hypothetical protein